MTKKDYQAIARAIHSVSAGCNSAKLAVEDVRDTLADVFAADSLRFDRARFVEACETGRCKGMRS